MACSGPKVLPEPPTSQARGLPGSVCLALLRSPAEVYSIRHPAARVQAFVPVTWPSPSCYLLFEGLRSSIAGQFNIALTAYAVTHALALDAHGALPVGVAG